MFIVRQTLEFQDWLDALKDIKASFVLPHGFGKQRQVILVIGNLLATSCPK